MPRLLLRRGEVSYLLCQMHAMRSDGSLYLQLVREGHSVERWNGSPGEAAELVKLESPVPKTKYVSVHTTGRIHYRMDGERGRADTLYTHCLLDQKEPEWVISYLVPGLSRLDAVEQTAEDHVVVVDIDCSAPIVFHFQLISFEEPLTADELGRVVVCERYGLRVVMSDGRSVPRPVGTPEAAFVCLRPSFGLRKQAIDRTRCYIKYKRLQYKLGEAGGLIGPDERGIWEAICAVPMREHPKLLVQFESSRFYAEQLKITPDEVLQCVRVKFKVREKKSRSVVKSTVAIKSFSLDAEI